MEKLVHDPEVDVQLTLVIEQDGRVGDPLRFTRNVSRLGRPSLGRFRRWVVNTGLDQLRRQRSGDTSPGEEPLLTQLVRA